MTEKPTHDPTQADKFFTREHEETVPTPKKKKKAKKTTRQSQGKPR